jgi:hypothetical protein
MLIIARSVILVSMFRCLDWEVGGRQREWEGKGLGGIFGYHIWVAIWTICTNTIHEICLYVGEEAAEYIFIWECFLKSGTWMFRYVSNCSKLVWDLEISGLCDESW